MNKMMVALLVVCVASVASGETGAARTGAAKPATRKSGGSAATPGAAQKAGSATPAPAAAPMTEDEQALFALGVQLGGQASGMVKPLELTPSERAAFKKGMAAGIDGEKSPHPFEQYQQRLSARAQANAARLSAANKERGTAFREQAAVEPGATRTASGLVFRSLQPGEGESPKAGDRVRVHYRGTLVDGTQFDASAPAAPASLALDRVIPCWTEGLQRMKVGEKARLVCPPEIAYGERGQGSIPPGSTLVFEVELVGIGAEAPAATAPGGTSGAVPVPVQPPNPGTPR